MFFERRFAAVALFAMALVGCGGGGSTSVSAGRGRFLRYGLVSSPVADRLAQGIQGGAFGAGAEVRRGDIVALDGDAVSPVRLQNDPEIGRALRAGASVLLLDARPEHKAALEGLVPGYPDGNSHALMFSSLDGSGGARSVHILELPAGTKRTTTSTVKIPLGGGGAISGETKRGTSERRATGVALEAFARRARALANDPWTDPLAATVPPLVSWMSVAFEVVEQSDDPALNGQPITENVQFIFRGFASPPAGDGPFANSIAVEHDGAITVSGQKATGPFDQGSGEFEVDYGWFQSNAEVDVFLDRTVPSGQQFATGAAVMDVNGETYQGRLNPAVFYNDASGNMQYWQPNWTVPNSGFQTVPGWTVDADGFNDPDPTFRYFQTAPFDAGLASPDYINATDPNNVGSFKALPDASNGEFDFSGASVFSSLSRVLGPVRFNLRVGRTYTTLRGFYFLGPPLLWGFGGGTAFEEDGNHPFVIFLSQCRPAGGATIQTSPTP